MKTALVEQFVNQESDMKVYQLAGRIDAARVEKCKKDILAEIEEMASGVVVSLEQVTFVDSTGLGFLVAIRRQQLASGRRIALCCPNAKVKMLLELTRMHQIFDVYDSTDDALAAA